MNVCKRKSKKKTHTFSFIFHQTMLSLFSFCTVNLYKFCRALQNISFHQSSWLYSIAIKFSMFSYLDRLHTCIQLHDVYSLTVFCDIYSLVYLPRYLNILYIDIVYIDTRVWNTNIGQERI